MITKNNAKEVTIFVHNLNFDGAIIVNSLTKNKIKFEMFSNKTNIYWIKIDYCGKLIIFRCSYKILSLPLKLIGDILGVKKIDFDHASINEYIVENMNEDMLCKIIKYCEKDVEITKKIIQIIYHIVNEECNGALKNHYAIASLSNYIYYNKYNVYKIDKKISVRDEEYIRPSYFGGRCEVFGNVLDNEHIKYYDVKGMYSQCMLEYYHCGKSYVKKPTYVSEAGFYTITFFSNINIPVLPVKHEGKLMFLNGTFTGTYWYEEILYAIKNGCLLIEIHHALVYEKTEKIFENYVSKYIKLRDKGGIYDKLCKNMINSFYGSTALNKDDNINYVSYSQNEAEKMLNKYNVDIFYKINDVFILSIKKDHKYKFYNKETKKNKNYRNVSLASAIASKARIKLHKLFLSIEDDGGKILYCDTDSAFAAYKCDDFRASTSSGIIWNTIYKDGVFCLPKTYGVLGYDEKTEMKMKGVNNKNVSYSELKNKFYENESIVFYHQKFHSKKNFYITIKNQKKIINLNKYNKRIFDIEKKKTTPIYI